MSSQVKWKELEEVVVQSSSVGEGKITEFSINCLLCLIKNKTKKAKQHPPLKSQQLIGTIETLVMVKKLSSLISSPVEVIFGSCGCNFGLNSEFFPRKYGRRNGA